MIKSESNEKFNRVESTLSFQGTANFLDLDQENFFMYQENLRAWTIIIEYAHFWSPLSIFWDFFVGLCFLCSHKCYQQLMYYVPWEHCWGNYSGKQTKQVEENKDNLGHISILIPANSGIVNISISAFITFQSEKIFPSLDLQNAFDLESWGGGS